MSDQITLTVVYYVIVPIASALIPMINKIWSSSLSQFGMTSTLSDAGCLHCLYLSTSNCVCKMSLAHILLLCYSLWYKCSEKKSVQKNTACLLLLLLARPGEVLRTDRRCWLQVLREVALRDLGLAYEEDK